MNEALPCELCGYDVRGSATSDRCPECGKPVTYRRPGVFDRLARLLVAFFIGLVLFLLLPALVPTSPAGEIAMLYLLASIPLVMWLVYRGGRLSLIGLAAVAVYWVIVLTN